MRRWLTIALPAGRYRLGKSVMDFRSAGDYDQRDYYAVFSLARPRRQTAFGDRPAWHMMLPRLHRLPRAEIPGFPLDNRRKTGYHRRARRPRAVDTKEICTAHTPPPERWCGPFPAFFWFFGWERRRLWSCC